MQSLASPPLRQNPPEIVALLAAHENHLRNFENSQSLTAPRPTESESPGVGIKAPPVFKVPQVIPIYSQENFYSWTTRHTHGNVTARGGTQESVF